ncbi:aspartate--ammonia ligase [Flavobacterium sp. I3-2]|uniref:aspartate--ammonia ligase n=1 Tax=Flavobacterium sp. I3-2 TaxID=2748319 RepID=UPI0015B2944C|nr:aspartate--ammonia ligase [Flavobacterium sp. I3-2]
MCRIQLENEQKIAFVKKTFSHLLCEKLNLIPISSPLMVLDGLGINDDLNGIERPVRFPIKSMNDKQAVIVHSLAKWKRIRLKEYEIKQEEGILTNMSALRPDEDYSPIHSIFVDQWDWEIRMNKTNRTISYLKENVLKIYESILETEKIISEKYTEIKPILPQQITFIHTEELLQLFPNQTAKEREHLITEKHGAVFLIGIGAKLSSGQLHDGRAADYDDWSTETELGKGLNGDLLVWNPVLKQSFELSSMGIRVDKMALHRQLIEREQEDKLSLSYHQMIMNDEIPLSVGGGIGQSRLCMFLLRKQHIGEVQVSLWDDKIVKEQLDKKIIML